MLGRHLQVILLLAGGVLITACEEKTTSNSPPTDLAPASAVSTVQGRVSVSIAPADPTVADCLQLIVKQSPANSRINWQVNGQPVVASEPGKLCSAFKRGDQVTVSVGTAEAGGRAEVTIVNTPPRVVGIEATPKDWRSGVQVAVFPKAEDADGDEVEFRYQWLINDEADPFLTESILPADRNRRGDRIQLLITPFDGESEGPVYQSYAMPVPGSPPRIVSKPPASFEALEYSYQVKANDPDGDKLTFALESPPQGMLINQGTGKITWPLTGVTPGKYQVKITVRDPEGGEDRQEFVLTLGEPKE